MFTYYDIGQVVFYLVALTILTPLLGGYMARVFAGEKNFLTPVFSKLENFIYKLGGIISANGMDWKTYTVALLIFNFFGFFILFLLQLFQSSLPLNPQGLPNVSWDLSLNTAVSFMTNTNWQSYAGETALSYLIQMAGLTVQNFISAATGIAVMIALIRGIVGKTANDIGNFWVDLIRSTIYVLLPLAILFTILFAGQGVVQTFSNYKVVRTLEGAQQTIPLGPAASQVAIKQLGTNGGGFFNVNSAHPFENPTPFSNFLEMLAILLIPSALVYTYGKMVGSTRQGWTLWGCMMFLFIVLLTISLWSEYHSNPVSQTSAGMEGKETRFGVTNSVLWSVATTSASNGSVNAMHDSLTPLSGFIALLNIMLGEIIFGGVGAGMYGMLVFVILTVFISGLMVGRTPEYLGKKIEAFEVKMAALAVLAPCVVILVFSAIASVRNAGLSSLGNSGPHGFSEILYAFTSAAGNNGSAFAGLNTNTPFYNIMIAIGMLIGRFGVLVPMLAIAGSLGRKKIVPVSSGTFKTDTFLFALLLIGVILVVGALTFFPALSLGPIVEHLLMLNGQSF
ncbi:MAG: potassium-transporting ATPase subunit KdpA [Ignavibacteriales bacterium]|nr:potassium-transporting ATPase subunit KdpA [Ignavibacteriales bacterium]